MVYRSSLKKWIPCPQTGDNVITLLTRIAWIYRIRLEGQTIVTGYTIITPDDIIDMGQT